VSGSKHCRLPLLIFLFTFFFNGLFAINVRAGSAPLLFISGPNQLSVNQTATLTVSGGCGEPYIWGLSGGGWLSSTTGQSVTYHAPASNPNCVNNALVSVKDKAGQIAYKSIAISAYPSGTLELAGYIKRCGHSYYCKPSNIPNTMDWYCALVYVHAVRCDGQEDGNSQYNWCGGFSYDV